MRNVERRVDRSNNKTYALRKQLEACRTRAGLKGMILSSEDGLCLAASGDTDVCSEVAAQLPLFGRKVPEFAGVLLTERDGLPFHMRRFEVAGTELYVAAVGDDNSRYSTELTNSISAATRILAA